MKNFLITVALLTGVFAGKAIAQESGNEKMKPFAEWIGRWQGEGSMQMGPGAPKRSTVDEHIESKLDGTIIVVEGVGKSIDPNTKQETVTHHAFGILSYDAGSSQYKFRSYLKDGRSVDAWFNVTGDNQYQWGFDIPNRGKTRYTITLDPAKKTWNEIGEFSADGTAWSKFFEMTLTKTE